MIKACDVLRQAADTIESRAAERDMEAERSMRRAVNAFNALTCHTLTETDGWLFMVLLKASRATAGSYQPDDYLDMAAYAALAAECEANEGQEAAMHRNMSSVVDQFTWTHPEEWAAESVKHIDALREKYTTESGVLP